MPTTPTTPTNVYQKLMQVRVDLQSIGLKKSGRNKFVGYDYFELKDFLPEAQSYLLRRGLCSIVTFTEEAATLTIVNMDKPEEVIVFTSPMSTANLKGCHPVQNVGGCETYQRRYLYMNALELSDADPLDASQGSNDKTEKAAPEAKPAEKPLPKNVQTVIAVVVSGKARSTKTGKTFYEIAFVDEDGKDFSATTWSASLYKDMAKMKDKTAEVSYEVNGNYKNLIYVKYVGDSAQAQEEQPPPPTDQDFPF